MFKRYPRNENNCCRWLHVCKILFINRKRIRRAAAEMTFFLKEKNPVKKIEIHIGKKTASVNVMG